MSALLLVFVALSSGCVESWADQHRQSSSERLAKRVILTRNCGSCHTLHTRGLELHGKVGPDLTQQGRRERSSEWLRRQLLEPHTISDQEVAEGYAGKQRLMPPLKGVSEAELEAVVAFLQRLE